MPRSGRLHLWKKPNTREREVLASPVHQNSSINTQIKVISEVQLYFNKKQQLPAQVRVVACPCKSLTASKWHFSAYKALLPHSAGIKVGSGHRD